MVNMDHMSLINRLITSTDERWTWFLASLITSFLPVIIRFCICFDTGIGLFDFKDLLFAGLGLNLANFNLMGWNEFDYRERVFTCSALLISIISVFLALFFLFENGRNPLLIVKSLSVFVVVSSCWISYATNRHIYNIKTPKNDNSY